MTTRGQSKEAELVSQVIQQVIRSQEFLNLLKGCIEEALDSKIEPLRKQLDNMNGKILDLETKLEENQCIQKQLNEDVIKAHHQINELEQYSRRNCLRISGVKEENNESCNQLIMDIAKTKLDTNITPNDIDRAHRLGPKRNDGKERPMIVKFTSYDARDRFIRARRKLKGSSIVVREDLTKANQELLFKVKEYPTVKTVWSHDGKIIALITKDGREFKKRITKLSELDNL